LTYEKDISTINYSQVSVIYSKKEGTRKSTFSYCRVGLFGESEERAKIISSNHPVTIILRVFPFLSWQVILSLCLLQFSL